MLARPLCFWSGAKVQPDRGFLMSERGAPVLRRPRAQQRSMAEWPGNADTPENSRVAVPEEGRTP
jgi:hypothetical protein